MCPYATEGADLKIVDEFTETCQKWMARVLNAVAVRTFRYIPGFGRGEDTFESIGAISSYISSCQLNILSSVYRCLRQA